MKKTTLFAFVLLVFMASSSHGMMLIGGVPPSSDPDFKLTIKCLTANDKFTFRTRNIGTWNATIDWGDGSPLSVITTYNDADKAHTYSCAPNDTFDIVVSGTWPTIYMNASGDSLMITKVTNLGDVGWMSFYSAFNGCSNITELSPKDAVLTSVDSTAFMFKDIDQVTTIPYLSEWNMSNVTTTYDMFRQMSDLTSPPAVGAWDVSNVTNMEAMFYATAGGAPPDVSSWDVSSVTNFREMFGQCKWSTPPDVSSWDVSAVVSFQEMFSECNLLTSAPDTSGWDNTPNLISASPSNDEGCLYRMFKNNSGYSTPPDVAGFDVGGCTGAGAEFYETFSGMTGLTTPPNVASWDVSGAEEFAYMFQNMSSVTSPPDVSSWNVSSAVDLRNIFFGMSSLTTPPDVSDWNTAPSSTSSITVLLNAFYGMNTITTPPDVSGWDVSAVTTFNRMFYDMDSVTSPPDVSSWTTTAATNMYGMFEDMTGLSATSPPDVSGFDMNGVTDARNMLKGLTSLTTPPNISSWDTSTIQQIDSMFYNMNSVTSAISISDFDIDSVTSGGDTWLDYVAAAGVGTTELDGFLLNAYQRSTYGGGSASYTAGLTWDFQGLAGNDQCYTNSASVSVGNSGTTTSDTADKLEDNGGTPDFTTTVQQYDCVHNTTDNTWAIVTAVDDNDTLSVSPDIMDASEAYTIEDKTDVECAIQALSISSKDNFTILTNGACP